MIPIFRAKKIDSDEYVKGFYIYNKDENKHYIFSDTYFDLIIKTEWCHEGISIEQFTKIDITTLAIHFPDMLDSQGNKIFASLSEDGKGGDICYVRDFSCGDLQGIARYEDNYFRIHRKGKVMGISLKCRDIKVIGIHNV